MGSRSPLTIVLLAAILALAGGLSLYTAAAKGATIDETHYIGVGRHLVTYGEWNLGGAIFHPPLSYYLNSIRTPGLVHDAAEIRTNHDELGRRLLAQADGTEMLQRARWPFVPVHLLGVLLVFAAGCRWFGRGAGLAAALFYALEPTVLAHASLATQDSLLTVLFFASVVLTEQWVRGGSRRHLVAAGVVTGLALLAKYSALLLVGILPVLVILSLAPGTRRAGFLRLLASCGIAFVILHVGYLPLYLNGGGTEYALPAPFVEGIFYQLGANADRGHPGFFLGRISADGWLAYFPVGLAVKSSVALLIAAAIGVVARIAVLRGAQSAGRRRAELWLWLAPLAFLGFFVFVSNLTIGVRYVLPVYPFLALLAGCGIAYLFSNRGILPRALAVVLILLVPVTAIVACPDYLPYFNEFAGGTEGGKALLGDSNLDWGQDLPGLAAWMRENDVPTVYLSYFGHDDPKRYGIAYHYVPGWTYSPDVDFATGRSIPDASRDYLAIGRTLLQGFTLPEPDLFHWLYHYERVALIGGSIEVFDLAGSGVAHENLAGIYERVGMVRLAAFERERIRNRKRDQGE